MAAQPVVLKVMWHLVAASAACAGWAANAPTEARARTANPVIRLIMFVLPAGNGEWAGRRIVRLGHSPLTNVKKSGATAWPFSRNAESWRGGESIPRVRGAGLT